MTSASVAVHDPAFESLLAFWAEAGVDAMLLDAPVDRLAAGLQALAPAPVSRGPTTRAKAGVLDIPAAVEAARLAAGAAQDLAALEAAVRAFEGCPLSSQGARRAVFARGAAQADVVVVGDPPGPEEDAEGQPFAGRTGRFVDRMLGAAGLGATGLGATSLGDRCLLMGTVFWRPPGDRAPSLDEIAICRPFLDRAIALVQPRLILLLGAAATRAMLGRDEGILELRGRWFEWRDPLAEREIAALPTLSPAFLISHPSAKKRVWSDLLTFQERLDRPDRPG